MSATYKEAAVAALAGGLRAIEAFDSPAAALTLTDVARRARLTRATARRYLHTLCELGYAEFDGKRFRLTSQLLRLGYRFILDSAFTQAAIPVLDRLVEETGEIASLGILDRGEVVFVARSTPRALVSGLIDVGARLPAFNASSGRVLLAARRDEEIQHLLRAAGPLRQFTPHTKTAPEEVIAEIHRTRAAGFGVNDEEIKLGIRSVAVPVLSSSARVVGAISLSLLTSHRGIQKNIASVLPVLRERSKRLGARL